MASFFDHPFYRLNKRFLSQIGTWPEQSLLMRCLMPFLAWAGLMSVVVPEIIRLSSVFRDVDTLMDCLPPLMIISVSFMQLFSGSFKRNTIQKMINRIPQDWKRHRDSPNIEILKKYAIHGHDITKGYSILIYSSCIVYLITPVFPIIIDFIVPLNESRKKTYLFEAEYGVNSDDYYWPILAHAYFVTVLSVIIIVSNDAMFFAMVEHACGLFEIVGATLKMIHKDNIEGGKDDRYKMICYCVDLHREAIIFAGLIEASYSAPLLGVIGFSVLILSITGVQTVMHLDEPEEALRYGNFTIGQVCHLYFNSVPGQKIMDYSLSVFDHAYAVDWHELSPKAQKLLLVIMMRSLRPCKITAGKIYIVSMENYLSVMQTSMSYFTVLSSMR